MPRSHLTSTFQRYQNLSCPLICVSRSTRLSEILRHQATLLEHIVTEQRYYSDYYLVTFYGNFPAAIRDKRFIVSNSSDQ